jgi:HEPN domain-containing protein
MNEQELNDARSELVRAWLERARCDLESARKLATGPEPYLDTAAYHCQQAGEKAVKGLLAFHDHKLEKTHDLEALVDLAEAYEPTLREQMPAAKLLTPYATRFRYIGGPLEPAEDEFLEALRAAEGLYTFVLSLLPEEVHL